MSPTRELARTLRDQAASAHEPILAAINSNGAVHPDLIWNPRRGVHGEYVIAGEFQDVRSRFIRLPDGFDRTLFQGVRVDGNLDEIAADANVSEQDVIDFLAHYRKPTIADFIDEAKELVGDPTADRIDAVIDIIRNLGFEEAAAEWVGRRRFIRGNVAVDVGANTTCVAGANLRDARYGKSALAAWAIFKTDDYRTIETAIASAVFVDCTKE